jgi:hypothetical protein
MKSATLPPNKHLRLKYSVPEDGLISFSIDAEEPIKSYVVGPKGLKAFYEDKPRFKYYGGFPEARRHHGQELRLPFKGSWYLLIVNPYRNKSVPLTYEVSY